MRLTFAAPYKSITSLPSIELPSFSILTGPNGTGKSHLLEAIKNGGVTTDIAQPEEIRLFDWTTFVPKNVPEIDAWATAKERRDILQALERSRADQDATSRAARHHNISLEGLERPESIGLLDVDQISDRIEDKSRASDAHTAVQRARDADEQRLKLQPKLKQHLDHLKMIANAVGKKRIIDLSKEDILQENLLSWGKNNRSFSGIIRQIIC